MMPDFLTAEILYKSLLCTAMLAAFACKLFFLFVCTRYFFKTPQYRLLLGLIILALACSLVEDASNILSLILYTLCGLKGCIPPFTLLCRIAWSLKTCQSQAIAIFLEFLVAKKLQMKPVHYLLGALNLAISSSFLYLAFFKYAVSSSSPTTLPFEIQLVKAVYILLPLLFIPAAVALLKKIRSKELPRVLVYQIKYFLVFLAIYLLIEIANSNYSYLAGFFKLVHVDKNLFHALCAFLSTILFLLMGKKLMGLRFLNIRKDIESQEKFNFLTQFKDILEQVRYVTGLKELVHITQTFYQTAFGIPLGRTRFFLRTDQNSEEELSSLESATLKSKIETCLRTMNEPFAEALTRSKIFVRDDAHFTYYCTQDATSQEIVQFLDLINADIFVPIYERNAIVASIVVEKGARPHKLFTNKERDEMLVFTTYVSNIITSVRYSNVEALLQKHNQLNQELYHKHQEIMQYKESMRSFIRSNKENKVGIIFYKNRKFIIANEAGRDLVGIDLNASEGHYLTQALKTVARRVEEYKSSQSTFSRDAKGTKIVITGILSPEHATILLLSYPEVADIVKAQVDQLKDPSHWDYLLYLETTKSGQIINELIPGTGETMLNFKIKLLSTALSKKATLLTMPEEDLLPTVEILHAISLRQTLHMLKLTSPEKQNEVGIKLFGLNPLMEKEGTPALLEKLDTSGTLYIENIEYLSKETQETLAQFISFGFFHKFKSDYKVLSNVRIICSSTKNLLTLVHEGLFSAALFNELKDTSLTMPSLHELSDDEMTNLSQGFADQIMPTQTYKNLLAFTDKEKKALCTDRPLSLRECKERIHDLLVEKATKHTITEVTEIDPAYNITDPQIAHAVRLGKKALKDPHIMSLLWDKFKNQNKIATLLGVNRSSVNRRCQEYNLGNLNS